MRAPALPLFVSVLGLLPLLSSAIRAADVEVQLPAGDGFVVKDNTGAVERLRVDEANGNVSRNGALFVHTTGALGGRSTFVGEGAGNLAISGYGLNTAFGKDALTSTTSGAANAAFGDSALTSNTTGDRNSAFGRGSLLANTTASDNSAFGHGTLGRTGTGSGNTAFGNYALSDNVSGSVNAAFGFEALHHNTSSANAAFGTHALKENTSGMWNTGVGFNALSSNTTGERNAAFGHGALRDSTTASYNAAFGRGALYYSTTGAENAAFGANAMVFNSSGQRNAAFGMSALLGNTNGNRNTAIGYSALRLNRGNDNVGLGHDAGRNNTIGSDNIYIANAGTASANGRIAIGTVGTHTTTAVAGIYGSTAASGLGVLVAADGTLGTSTSSARFKRDVEPMADASDALLALRPVAFRYREAPDVPQYGLIAEEVAAVAPELVARDGAGRPYSVRYHLLAPMLLNELQKQERRGHEQQRTIEALLARVEGLERWNVPGTEGSDG